MTNSQVTVTTAVYRSINTVPKDTPFFLLLIPVLLPVGGRDYQTWLRIAAASTEKTMIPAITSATTFVIRSLRSFLLVLITHASCHSISGLYHQQCELANQSIAIRQRGAYNRRIAVIQTSKRSAEEFHIRGP